MTDKFRQVLEEMYELHSSKSADYGTAADPYANIRASEEFGIPGWLGAIMRLNDKITRIKTFTKKGSLTNESLEESLKDIPVYAAIALLLYREENALPPLDADVAKSIKESVMPTETSHTNLYLDARSYLPIMPSHGLRV